MTTTINTNLLLDISIFWTGGGRHKIETTQLDSMANGRYEHMDQLNHFVGSGTSVVLLYLLVVLFSMLGLVPALSTNMLNIHVQVWII